MGQLRWIQRSIDNILQYNEAEHKDRHIPFHELRRN
jgi:hypothetical protein